MSDEIQGAASCARLRYQRPEIERIGSIAEITAASGGTGNDSLFGYPADEHSPSFPPS